MRRQSYDLYHQKRVSKMSKSGAGILGGTFGCFLIVLAFNLLVGALMFQYCLFQIIGKDVPWYVDAIAGLFLAEFLLPVTVVCWVLTFVMEAPFLS
jgi:hypothetical protein